MLTLINQIQTMMENKIEYTCPKCEEKDVFFRWAPKNCPNCNCDLPDLYSFIDSDIHSESEVIKWHFKEDTAQ